MVNFFLLNAGLAQFFFVGVVLSKFPVLGFRSFLFERCSRAHGGGYHVSVLVTFLFKASG